VSLKDVATNNILYADVTTTDANTITIGFGEVNSITDVRVVVIG